MPFSGGGGGQLSNHVHDNTPLQGGPLDLAGVTIGSLNSGDLTYSDGAALQQLAIAAPNDQLRVSAGNIPEWFTPAAGSATYELVDTETLGVDTSNITLTFPAITGSTVSQFIMTFNGSVDTAPEEIGVRINGLTGAGTYIMERLNVISGATSASTHTGSYWKPCPANSSMRFFGSMNIQVGQFGTTNSIYMISDFVSSAAHYLYSGYISGSTDTTLSQVQLYCVGAGGNIRSGSCASLFKINI